MRRVCVIMVGTSHTMSPWFAWLAIAHISEIDCKDRFNTIPLTKVLLRMGNVSDWLT